MAITDPAGTTYVNNMYVTNPTTKTASSQTGSAAHTTTHQTTASQAAQTTASTTSSQNELAKNFTTLLQTVMTNKAVSSISDFSGSNSGSDSGSSDLLSGLSSLSGLSGLTGLSGLSGLTGTSGLSALSGISALSGLSGLSSGAESLLGLEGADNSYMSLMLLYLMMAAQNKDGQNNALINALSGNTTQQTAENTQKTAEVADTAQSTVVTGTCKHAVAKAVQEQNSGGIPSNSWIVANPALTNLTGTRNAALYSAIINQFNVEDNERYRVNKQGIGDTYCNIYTWDITRAMGAEIPHFIEEATGKPVTSGGEGIKEMTANDINDWLHTYGEQYGWTQVTAQEAQEYANQGSPAITSWKNPDGHGHLQVVCPSRDGTYNQERGVTISQAGRYLKQYDYIDSVYGENGLRSVEYFVHK